jgi:hypothetical protein
MQTIDGPAFSFRSFALLGARVALMLALVVGVDQTFAAKVYRCGNLFQDQPCDTPKTPEIRPADKAAVPTPAATPSKVATRPPAGATDRLVLDPPASVVVEARR